MSYSFNKIWIHAIWATKERAPLMHRHVENKIYSFISDQLREQSCPTRIVNGMPDHIHCLFLLNPQKSIAEVIKQIKGSSSHYINQQDLIPKNSPGKQVLRLIQCPTMQWIKFFIIYRIKKIITGRNYFLMSIMTF